MVRLSPRLAALLLLPPLLWASNAVVGRLVVGLIPPLLLNALRWSVALALLLPLGWRALGSAPARAALRRRWRYLTGLGVFGIASYNALQYVALTTTTAVNATLITAGGPVWMMLLGAWCYGERPRRRQWAGSALSIAGVLIVIARGDLRALAQVRFVAGDLLMLLASVIWAVYSWWLARPPASMRAPQRPDWDWAEFLVVQMLFGIGWSWLWVAGAAAAGASPAPPQWSAWTLLTVLYVAIGPSIVAYWSWGSGVVGAGPTLAAFFANLSPLFAALLSALVVGEAPQPHHALAFALIVGGIVVSSRR